MKHPSSTQHENNAGQHRQAVKPPATPRRSLWAALIASLLFCFLPLLTTEAKAEWIVDGTTVYFTDHVGYSDDGASYSGTVSLRMDQVTVSGQLKIVTTILSVVPEPGFESVIKKSGGANGSVEIEFASATCQSKFSFLYKPGLFKGDYGTMRCR